MTAVRSSIVGPAPGARLDSQGLLDLAGHLQAVADPTRLRLLAVVLAAPAQTACVRDSTTAAGLAQPMVSHHLQILHRAALVTRTKRGSYVYYQADTARWRAVGAAWRRGGGPGPEVSVARSAGFGCGRADRCVWAAGAPRCCCRRACCCAGRGVFASAATNTSSLLVELPASDGEVRSA
jgi:ArsR family transcriptional regulator